ncbi:hypothetical protein COOONC_23179 [Cooperia oncophora]
MKKLCNLINTDDVSISEKFEFSACSLAFCYKKRSRYVALSNRESLSDSLQMARRSTASLILICSILSLITNFPSGYTNATINTAVASVERYIRDSYNIRGYNISEDVVAIVKGIIINCWFIMMVFGAAVTPYVTDTYGRKIGYIIATGVAVAATIIQYLSVLFHVPETFVIGRSLTAFCSPLADACLLLYLQALVKLSDHKIHHWMSCKEAKGEETLLA